MGSYLTRTGGDTSGAFIKFRDEIKALIAAGKTPSEQRAHLRHISEALRKELGVKPGDFELFLNGSVDDQFRFIRKYGTHVAAVPTVISDLKGRIKKVTATILPQNLYGGTRASRDGISAADDAGHIIGRLLGGLGGKDAQNVFGQLPAINRGPFRDFERDIAEKVLAGRLVEVEVILNYVGDSTRPSGIIYKVKVDGVPWQEMPFKN